ncbi:Crp/Fnr family transcriptional regulator [Portibacter lacus]|uniref:Transcriptional regulator n=1 Tax=Portibacter lacus TaxID=1099794 RepID=A0AA37SP45_9BACT|nr:Crp/Fnr family transcriptional regulator [Portibacter lacus]GLR17044.1 putative transcriptional regulator [Portibacter lacus]
MVDTLIQRRQQTNRTLVMDNSIWYLENIDVTGIFCPEKLGNALEEHDQKVFKKGEYIYLPDQSSDKIFFMTKGRVKIGNYSDSGKEITKAILNKGEVFGELSLVGEDTRRDFAFAMEETTVCAISSSEMTSLIRDHSSLSMFMMKIMGSRVLEMEQRLESLVFKDSRTRIIEFLLDLANKKGERVGFERVVRKFITHQEIANLTATSRQTVTTVLNELRTKNLLTFNRKRLLIRDMEKLRSEMTS